MKFISKALMVAVVSFVLVGATNAFAGDPLHKLGRGIANVGFGALEIPMKIYDENKNEGGIAAVTHGPLKGIAFFVAREVVGVIEIVTFLIPLPGCPDDPRDAGWGYGPIMRPEWVVDTDHNYYNIVYPDSPPMDL